MLNYVCNQKEKVRIFNITVDIEQLKLTYYYLEINIFPPSRTLGSKDRVLKLFEKFTIIIALGANFFNVLLPYACTTDCYSLHTSPTKW